METKRSGPNSTRGASRAPFWIALALVLVGAAGLVWLVILNKPASPAPPVATRTPRPTFTLVAQVAAASPTSLARVPTETAVPPSDTPVQPTATQAPPTLTSVPATATPVPATATPEATPMPPIPPSKPLRMNSPEYGMQAFLWWRPEVASRDMGMIKEAGFGWVKQNIGWREVEGAAKGVFDWSRVDWIVAECNKLGLDLLVRIDHQPQWAGGNYPANGPPDNYADLGDFLHVMASRYRGRIRAYEIWNEPNYALEWGGRSPNAA